MSALVGATADVNQPLVEIADPSAVDVLLSVTPEQAAQIHAGDTVTLTAGQSGVAIRWAARRFATSVRRSIRSHVASPCASRRRTRRERYVSARRCTARSRRPPRSPSSYRPKRSFRTAKGSRCSSSTHRTSRTADQSRSVAEVATSRRSPRPERRRARRHVWRVRCRRQRRIAPLSATPDSARPRTK